MLVVTLPVIGDSGDGTCWIAKDPAYQSLNWFQLTFFVPLFVYFLMAIVALIYATMRTKQTNALIRAKTPDEREKKANERLLMRMRFFVIIFILFWLGKCVLYKFVKIKFQYYIGYFNFGI